MRYTQLIRGSLMAVAMALVTMPLLVSADTLEKLLAVDHAQWREEMQAMGEYLQEYGDRLTLIGNVDCATVLIDGPVEAVRAQTEQIIRAAAPGGGFLLSTSNSVHPGVKPEYYLAMLETARAVGDYPISI